MNPYSSTYKDSKPPEFPRPSSSLSKNVLKNRMVVKTKANTLEVGSGSLLTLKNQESSKSLYENNTTQSHIKNGVFLESSLMSLQSLNEETSVCTMETTSKLMQYAKLNIMKSKSLHIPGAEFNMSNEKAKDSQIAQKDMNKKQNKKGIPHMSLLPTKRNGQDGTTIHDLIEMVVSGEIEFCYLLPDHMHSKYGLQVSSIAPSDLRESITLSRQGVTYFNNFSSELVSLTDYMREYSLYHQLIAIAVFGKFRLWYGAVI